MNSINETSMCSRNNRQPDRNLVHLALALLCMPFAACGGGSSSPTAPTPVAAAPTPQPCAQTVLFQGSGEVPSGTLLSLPVTASTGRLDVTADWTFTTNPVGLYVVQGACSLDQFNARNCSFLLRVEPGPKPLKGSATVQAGNYTVLVANFGTRGDSGAVQVVMSTGSCAAPTAFSTTSSAEAGIARAVQRTKTFSP